MSQHTRTNASGFSLIETTIILSVLTVLSGLLSPVVGDYVADARRVRAESDLQVLAVAVARFAFDAPGGAAQGWDQYELLVGAGSAPAARGAGTATWALPIEPGQAGSLDDHLFTNQADYARRTAGAGLCARGWSGPYLSGAVGSDPWGHRYSVSVRHLTGGTGAAAVAISAGPDGILDTPFDARVPPPASDDILVVLGGGR